MLINKNYGSYFLIGSLLLNKRLNISTKIVDSDHCGSCLACVEACPTLAINPNTRTVETEKCVPYFSIELFKDDQNPPTGYNEMDEVFGCDICQDVCPWNRKILNSENDVEVNVPKRIQHFFLEKSKDEIMGALQSMSKKGYKREFSKTSFERTGRDGIMKNLKYKK